MTNEKCKCSAELIAFASKNTHTRFKIIHAKSFFYNLFSSDIKSSVTVLFVNVANSCDIKRSNG